MAEFNYAGSSVVSWGLCDYEPGVHFNELADLVLDAFCNAIEMQLGYAWGDWRVDDFPCNRIRSTQRPEIEVHLFAPSARHKTEILMVVMNHDAVHTEKTVCWERFLWDVEYQQEVGEFLNRYVGEPALGFLCEE